MSTFTETLRDLLITRYPGMDDASAPAEAIREAMTILRSYDLPHRPMVTGADERRLGHLAEMAGIDAYATMQDDAERADY